MVKMSALFGVSYKLREGLNRKRSVNNILIWIPRGRRLLNLYVPR